MYFFLSKIVFKDYDQPANLTQPNSLIIGLVRFGFDSKSAGFDDKSNPMNIERVG
jgi:hypothetical protein